MFSLLLKKTFSLTLRFFAVPLRLFFFVEGDFVGIFDDKKKSIKRAVNLCHFKEMFVLIYLI